MSEVVPNGWTTATVGEIANVKRGASPRPIQDPIWWGGKVGWVRISDVTASRKYLTETTQYLSDAGVKKSVQIKKGEVILSICATIGRPIIVKVDACIHDGFVWFDKLREDIDREFWYYFLASKEEFLSSQRQSGTQGNLNTGIVSDLVCSIPPFKEQQKIASILTAVDKVIESTQAQINKLKDLKTGMMQELLTKGIGHTEFKDSPIGKIPKAWEIKKLEDVVISKGLQTGPFGSQLHSHEYVERGIPVVMPKDLKNQSIDTSTIAKISLEKSFELERHKLKVGDILFSRRGDIGRCAIVKKENEGWICGTGCLKVRLNKTVVPEFLISYLSLTSVVEWLNNNAVGQTMLNLNTSILAEAPVILPTLSEQKKIANSMITLVLATETKEKRLGQLTKLKSALMQDLLTGKVRV